MPHICTRCKNQLEAAPGQAPRCPVCGGTKFSFIGARKGENKPGKKEPDTHKTVSEVILNGDSQDGIPDDEPADTNSDINESIESIRIIEPGRYNLNLVRLAESDDRVISVGADGKYRLDLNSMMRLNKKKK